MLNTESSKPELSTKESTKNRHHTSLQPRQQSKPVVHHRPSRGSSQVAQANPKTNPSIEAIPIGFDGVSFAELPFGHFRGVEWPEVNLNGCDAHGADFCAAVLTGLCALGANFVEAQLEGAELANAALCGADLTKANLRAANLRNANLTWCNLRGAALSAADLRGANLAWADLREVDLRQTDLTGAYYNNCTQWPIGFDPNQAQLIHLAESR